MWTKIIEYLPLCRYIAGHFKVNINEAISDVGYDAIRAALESFEPGRGRTESSYVGFIFARRLIAHLKQPVNELLTDYEDSSKPDDLFLVKSIMNELDKYDRTLLILYYWCDFTYEDIGEMLGVCKATVCNNINRILKDIRRGWRSK